MGAQEPHQQPGKNIKKHNENFEILKKIIKNNEKAFFRNVAQLFVFKVSKKKKNFSPKVWNFDLSFKISICWSQFVKFKIPNFKIWARKFEIWHHIWDFHKHFKDFTTQPRGISIGFSISRFALPNTSRFLWDFHGNVHDPNP